jgi:DNA-directed RNA polymerase subunit RPC12/RpoP
MRRLRLSKLLVLQSPPKRPNHTLRFSIWLVYGEGEVHESRFRCGRCRTPLVPADEENLGRYSCSACGERALQRDQFSQLMWD